MSRIPDTILGDIRARVSIADVVSRHVTLKRQGNRQVGLCPFHQEKTPSFSVSEEKGLFHCFGCGAGGGVIDWVMRVEGVDFREAAEQLAELAGVEIPQDERDDAAARARDDIFAALDLAASAYHDALAGGGSEYFEARGIAGGFVDEYRLGWAPAEWRWLTDRMVAAKVPKAAAIGSGMAIEKDGKVFDRFRGRVMFPIRDRRGRVVAFGGRTLGDDKPKYLNSPETPVFKKGEHLYGLFEAREAARKAGRLVLVEGYMDALALVQVGIPAAACLGTALTAAQLKLARSVLGEEPALVLCYDGDEAGRAAGLRAFSVCAEAGVWAAVAVLPAGADPDSFARERGKEAVEAVLSAARPVHEHWLGESVPPGASLQERTRAAREVAAVVGRIGDAVVRDLVAGQAASALGVAARQLAPAGEDGARSEVSDETEKRIQGPTTWRLEERALVEAIAASEAAARYATEADVLDLFSAGELAEAGRRLSQAHELGEPLSGVVDGLPAEVAALVTGAALAGDGVDRLAVAKDCVRTIRARAARATRRARLAGLRDAETSGDGAAITAAMAALGGR